MIINSNSSALFRADKGKNMWKQSLQGSLMECECEAGLDL